MNIHDQQSGIDASQWQAQERARLAARDGGLDADPDELRIAHALRQAPAVDLPHDFASRVAGIARAQRASASLLEQRLLRGLTLVFGLSSAATVAYYGHAWVAALAANLPGGADALGWSAAALACVGANWAAGLLRERLQATRDRLA
ncbi:MAG: hypothetical protein V4704_10400 [Pseudomonadota bacterium]